MGLVMAENEKAPRVLAGRYTLGPHLGQGGMGVVRRARDGVLERDVAIKEIELPPELGGSDRDAVRVRVLREARATAALDFPGAVTIFDVVEEAGSPFIVMELVEGPTLHELVVGEGPLNPDEAARVGLDVLDALEVAHRNGIVHRDVKPGNVMLPARGRAKLADFGIASVKDDPKITASGIVLGSPSYMAPEQARSATSGPRSDLYSLGATLYFAVEGEPPFDRGRAIATLAAVVGDEPRQPIRAGRLGPVLLALLAKDPEERPSSALLRSRLEAVAGKRADEEPASTAAFPETVPLPANSAEVSEPSPPTPRPPTQAEPGGSGAQSAAQSAAPPEEWPAARPPRGPRWDLSRPEPARRSKAPWLALILVAVSAMVVAALFLSGRGQPPAQAGSQGKGKTSAEGTGGGSAAGQATAGGDEASPAAGGQGGSQPSTSTHGSSARGAGTPSNWQGYSDGSASYTISYPPDWTVSPNASGTDFTDPASGTYLRVAHTSTPGPSALGAWHSLSKDFASRHSGYETIRIAPTRFKGSSNAALWEYRYSEGGAVLHAVDLGFVIGHDGYALNFQTHESDWAGSQRRFEDFKSSFRPAP